MSENGQPNPKLIHNEQITQALAHVQEMWPTAGDAITEMGLCPDCLYGHCAVQVHEESDPNTPSVMVRSIAIRDCQLMMDGVAIGYMLAQGDLKPATNTLDEPEEKPEEMGGGHP